MRKCSLLSLAFWASFALTAANAEPHPSQGLWTAVDRVPFPSSASPPTDYAAARLDLAAGGLTMAIARHLLEVI